MVKKFSIWFMVLLVILLGGCAVKQNDSTSETPVQEQEPGITDDTILIGSNAPLTGPHAAYGACITNLEAYFKKINDEGGINGRKIKLVYYDDAYDASKTVGVMKKLVEQDKVFLTVVQGASPCAAVVDYLAEKNVPMMAITGNSQILTYQNAFEILPNFTTDGTVLAQYAVQKLGAKKIGIWYQNDDYGKEDMEAVKAELKKNGLEPVAAIPYNMSDTDFSIPVMQLKELTPDVVILIPTTKTGSAFMKQAYDLGLKTQFLVSYTSADLSVSTLAGPAAEGAIFAAFFPLLDKDSDPRVKEHKDFVAQYSPDKTPNSFTLYGQLYGEFIAEALKRAGKDLTREKVIEAIESMKNWNEGLAENVSFGPDQHGPGGESLYFIKLENGKFVRIQ
ncbi:ABC transporter substrate-binding protein [Candidatus Formimonas warabiya]|uniref:Leucine-binding protein domain-containing protein n=1 Tax=Formimonas warabiya TaxID=1761012 RepID=A0A3G1KQK4_FORW1|nr:ABC transporter substrate-binding protein [Candidatus Formimonas warabiya]ATW24749.1 hypothetical protein DCMF_08145 [Candidatus Formimonas warabiya]